MKSVQCTHATGSDRVLLKIVSLFLVAMAVMAMFGKLKAPKIPLLSRKKCAKCGRYKIGTGPCDCGTKG